jgi:hypothetical protein
MQQKGILEMFWCPPPPPGLRNRIRMEELLDPDPYSESDPAVKVQPGFKKDHVSMLKNVLFGIFPFFS